MRHLPLCLFLSLLVLFAGTARASVIVDGVNTGLNSYNVTSDDVGATFTGTGTLVQNGSNNGSDLYNGSLTGFSGILKITGTYWVFAGSNMVKGTGNDLELTIANDGSSAIFLDPTTTPIEFHYSVLNGKGTVRTSNATNVAACTLVLGTDTAKYDGANGHNFTGNIIKWNLAGGGQSYFNLKKVGTNTQTLSGNNTGLAGRIDVQGGMLVSNKSTALGTAHVYVSSGASLYFNDPQTVANAIDIAGTGVGNNTAALRVYGNITFSGNLTLTANSTIYVDKDKTGKITNQLAGGSNAYTLTKTGSGFLTIATAADKNSINGVVIQGGLLEAASANALGGATSGNHVKLAGGTLRLSTAVGQITFDTTGTPKGVISLNNTSTTQSWDLTNYLATANIDFVKIGAGTVRMTGNYSDKALKSAEIREGRIQIYGSTAEEARVFPVGANVQVKQGASVEYVKNPQDFGGICTYTLYGGELISNISGSHLTTGHVGLYGGTLTGIGNGSNYGNFLFDGNVIAYQSEINGGVSNINASKVDFGFRIPNATKAIQVKAGAQLNMNAVITSAFGSGVTYITKSGDGLLVFTKANTYNLPTNVNAGTLRLSQDGTLGNASKLVTVKSGATLEIANTKTVANALTISGTGVSTTVEDVTTYAGAVNFTNDATISGAVTLGANSSVNVANGKIGKLTGSVSGGSYTLTKTGAGTLRIDATESAFDVQDLIVSSGRLDFLGGTAGGITVQDAVFSPGNSPGEATVEGAFTLSSSNSTLLMEIGGTEPNQNDSLIITGDLNLNDGLIYLQLADTYSLNAGERFTAILSRRDNYTPESDFIEKYVRSYVFTDLAYELLPTGLYAITGTFDRNAVPEPSAWLLLALGAFGILRWRKR